MRIAIGSDHAGFELKERLRDRLTSQGHQVRDFGPASTDPTDYADIAAPLVDDPGSFTRTWTVAMPLNRDPTYQIYEYACHEGNYGLVNSLSAGRAEDAAAAR